MCYYIQAVNSATYDVAIYAIYFSYVFAANVPAHHPQLNTTHKKN